MELERRQQVCLRLRTVAGDIARSVTADFFDRHPDWLERYGDLARLRGEEDALFHVEFLAGAVLAGDAAAFATYARWTARVLAARGIAPPFLVENLEQVGAAAMRQLDEAGRALVADFVAAGIRALDGDSDRAEPATDATRAEELSLYLQAIRAGERRAALAVALEALRAGATVAEVYGEILQPAQIEIGRLWERNEATVAEEHMATAVTQYVVAQLYSRLEIPEATRGRALVTGVRGELHQLGANMVADVLEADGWDVRFLGTQLPHGGVLQAIEEHQPRLVGISATVLLSLPAVADLIRAIRERFGSRVFVVVGGAAFRASPGIWRELGADGVGQDLRDAVAVAAALQSGSAS